MPSMTLAHAKRLDSEINKDALAIFWSVYTHLLNDPMLRKGI